MECSLPQLPENADDSGNAVKAGRESPRMDCRQTTNPAPSRDQVAMNIESRTVQVNGLRTHYLSAVPRSGPGQDAPLVLLHGGGESASAWRWVMPRLAQRHCVLAPDLPGSGESDLVAGRYAKGWYGSFVAGFLDAVQIDHAVVVGHSLGGLAALQMALDDRGERVRGLVLVDSAGLGRELNPVLPLLTLPGLGDWSVLWALTPPGQFQRLGWRAWGCFAHPAEVPAGWYLDQFRLGLRPGLLWDQLMVSRSVFGLQGQTEIMLDRLSDLRAPTLIVWGDSDQIIPVAHAHQAVRLVRRGQLAIIPDCGHTPQVERPELFLEAIDPFLAMLARESASLP
jgi:pimeloyl-ACP methyl ester carboxylesterase